MSKILVVMFLSCALIACEGDSPPPPPTDEGGGGGMVSDPVHEPGSNNGDGVLEIPDPNVETGGSGPDSGQPQPPTEDNPGTNPSQDDEPPVEGSNGGGSNPPPADELPPPESQEATVTVSMSCKNDAGVSVPRTTVGFFDTNCELVLENTSAVDQSVVIPSITIEGNLEVTDVQLIDGTTALCSATLMNNHGDFVNCSVSIAEGEIHHLLLQAKLDPNMPALGVGEWSRSMSFGFTVGDVVASSATLEGLPVWGEGVYVQKGEFFYPCPQAFCGSSLEEGVKSVLFSTNESGSVSAPIIIRGDNTHFAYFVGTIVRDNLFGGERQALISRGDSLGLNKDCNGVGGDFDLYQDQNITLVVMAVNCYPLGEPVKNDVFLVKLDGIGGIEWWIRITDDDMSVGGTIMQSSPVFGSLLRSDGTIDILHQECNDPDGRAGGVIPTPIFKTTVNVVDRSVVGAKRLVMDKKSTYCGDRSIAVNRDFSKMAVVKDSISVNYDFDINDHIVVADLDGSNEVDRGAGFAPIWDMNSDTILYCSPSYDNTISLANSDGSVVIPKVDMLVEGGCENVLFK